MDRIVIEYLKRSVQRKYRIKMKSRDKIIDELRLLLQELLNYYIVRR